MRERELNVNDNHTRRRLSPVAIGQAFPFLVISEAEFLPRLLLNSQWHNGRRRRGKATPDGKKMRARANHGNGQHATCAAMPGDIYEAKCQGL